jgi:nitrate/TMAO reductase-like tetraheme cytochrome c subunit
LTVINVLLLSIGGHKAVTYMDSPRFCGTSCHTQMQPEWTAYQRSAHSQVACVECHIGPGTPAFVEAKLQGLSQLFGTLTGKYQRPVSPAKVHGQRTGAACEACHNRSIFVGDRVRMYPHYKLDKENSPAFNVMLIHVGGRSSDPTDAPGGEPDKYSGIHSHLAKNRIIRYEYLDAQRTRIGKITVLQDGKLKAEYRRPNADPKEKPLGEQVMECIDCHNRPAHRFDGTARQAVERAIFEGRLDAKQPYLAKVVTEVLGQAEVARDGAEAYFKKAIPAAYASMAERPSAEAMDQAIRSVTQIYLRNVFPKMKVRFDTYPDLAGHHAEAGDAHVGCLRCHDGQHEAKLPNGKSKTMDKSCDLCHDTLATEKPPEKFEDTLKQVLGLPLD